MLEKPKALISFETALISPNFDIQVWYFKKIAEKYQVSIILCPDNSACYQNPLAIDSICQSCKTRIRSSMSDNVHYLVARSNSSDRVNIDSEHDRFIESTYISRFRTSFPLRFRIDKHVKNALTHTFNSIYKTTSNFISDNPHAHLFSYNGRFNISGAIVSAATKNQSQFTIIELMGRDYNIFLADNAEVFDTDYWKNLIAIESSTKKDQLLKSGAQFFSDKLKGIRTNDFVYSKLKSTNLKSKNEYDILFIFSSEDEFASLGPKWESRYKSQELVVEDVSNAFESFKIAVRFHPNQGFIPSKELKHKISKLEKLANVVVYQPSSDISSYDLAQRSTLIIGFGSTFSLEAAHMGKMSIQVGHSLYEKLNILPIFHDSPSVIEFIGSNKDNYFFNKEMAELYAGFLMNYSSMECEKKYITDWMESKTDFPLSRSFSIIYNFFRLIELLISGRRFKYGFFGSIKRAISNRFA